MPRAREPQPQPKPPKPEPPRPEPRPKPRPVSLDEWLENCEAPQEINVPAAFSESLWGVLAIGLPAFQPLT